MHKFKRKSKKWKKWKIHFLQLFNFSENMKKENEWNITKNQKNLCARPPFFRFCIFSGAFLFHFLGKIEKIHKINFPFFNFSMFLKFLHFYRLLLILALTSVDGRLKMCCQFHWVPQVPSNACQKKRLQAWVCPQYHNPRTLNPVWYSSEVELRTGVWQNIFCSWKKC